ncbi:MAG: PEP-utilizing enzyme [Phenylobacterium sp.]
MTSPNAHPELVERLTDFLQDRGAVGMLLQRYEDGESLEQIALAYWESRLESGPARLEDLATTILIALFTGIAANIVGDMWKGEFGPLNKLFRKKDQRNIARLGALAERAALDTQVVLLLYAAKRSGAGTAVPKVGEELLKRLTQGQNIAEFVTTHAGSFIEPPPLDLIAHAQSVIRGVVTTETMRIEGVVPEPDSIGRIGLPLSPHLAFGEVINLLTGLGSRPHPWLGQFKRKLYTRRLYPDLWPSAEGSWNPSPKILILDNKTANFLHEIREDHLIAQAAGLIAVDGGMTSHLAVYARGAGIGAVGITLSNEELGRVRFALISSDRAYLYVDLPGMEVDQFRKLVDAMPFPRYIGDPA